MFDSALNERTFSTGDAVAREQCYCECSLWLWDWVTTRHEKLHGKMSLTVIKVIRRISNLWEDSSQLQQVEFWHHLIGTRCV